MSPCSPSLTGDINTLLIYWDAGGINIYERYCNGEIPQDAGSTLSTINRLQIYCAR